MCARGVGCTQDLLELEVRCVARAVAEPDIKLPTLARPRLLRLPHVGVGVGGGIVL
jgi:hypothetical protein